MSGKIEVIGLGAGNMNQLPLGIYKKLTRTKDIIMTRTIDHPVITSLKEEGVQFESYDEVYQDKKRFTEVYEEIVDDLLKKAQSQSIVYAVPGHPMLAEKTVQLLLNQEDIQVSIIGGQSYLDDLFTSLKIDPIEGFQFVDGTDFDRKQLNYRQHLIFCQVYDRFIASDLKLALLEDLPFDYPVTVIDAAGTESERIREIPLEELDHDFNVSNLTSVYVPPTPSDLLNHTFTRLKEVISTLRGPQGCDWDKAQTHESLREYLIEEAYELIDAINEQDDEGIIEELGDVLLQVMLHSQIGEDDGYFTIDDVIKSITTKMLHRHPHVFSDTHVDSVEEIHKNWEQLKQEEKGDKRQSILDGVPKHLPALLKAFKLQKKAAKVGFDWDNAQDIWDKLEEEIEEVQEAIQNNDQTEMINELGDVLFVVVNLARFYKVNPELALEKSNQKFFSRFTYIERQLRKHGQDINNTSLEEMDSFWNQAKRKE